MSFTKRALKEINKELQAVQGKSRKLQESFLIREYNHPRSKEYASHGFSRRVSTSARCIDNVFNIFPPDRIELPTHDELHDATINIQAFVFNVFGSIDDLAWIWVCENNLKTPDGDPIPNREVGLQKKNKLVRGSLSTGFRTYLESLDKEWFPILENFRHALAHRIPLYIPPYIVQDKNVKKYHELETLRWEVLLKGDVDESKRLSVEQKKLCVFRPWITHSIDEKAKHIVFHAQMLADFKTVDELGQKMLEEMKRRNQKA